MNDRIRIHGLLLRAVVGVHDWERSAARDVRIDVEVETDVRRAAADDDLAETVDYDILARTIVDRVTPMQPKLIETIAAVVADACLGHRLVKAVEVTVHKPRALDAADSVSVTIRRERA